MASVPVQIVTPLELRRLFNTERFPERLELGELSELIRQDRHPASPLANEPFCTQSQIVFYPDAAGDRVAVVHRYLRRDGTFGGSGLPDPKRLLLGGVIHAIA